MRKPTQDSTEANLQAIQTSVAFKHIADAIEQYRRQFGLAFLALIAFSAVHVGLVVIANLYTLQTKVEAGVLTSAHSSTTTEAVPVATAEALRTYDLAHIMSNLDVGAQKQALSSIKNMNFVDAAGKYRQYTVTGFELGGFLNSELKLYTAVGHILTYVRGSGLTVTTTEATCNNTCTATAAAPARKTRKLLQKGLNLRQDARSSAMQQQIDDTDTFVSLEAKCADSVTTAVTLYAHENLYDEETQTFDFSDADELLKAQAVQLAQCLWDPSNSKAGSSQQQFDARQTANSIAELQAYLRYLDSEIGFEYWDQVNGQTCEEGIIDSLDTSCQLFPNNPFTKSGVVSWELPDMVQNIEAGSYQTCVNSLKQRNAAEAVSMSQSSTMAAHISDLFVDTKQTIEDIADLLHQYLNGEPGATIGDLLEAFGLDKIEVDEEHGVRFEDPVLVDPTGLNEEQTAAVSAAERILEALAGDIIDLFDAAVLACQQQNSKIMALAMAPLIQGTIDYLSSANYANELAEAHTLGAAIEAEHKDTQLAKCAEGGAHAWRCANSDYLYQTCISDQATAVSTAICDDLEDKQEWKVSDGAGKDYTSAGGMLTGVTVSWGCITDAKGGQTAETAANIAAKGCVLPPLAMQTYDALESARLNAGQAEAEAAIVAAYTTQKLVDFLDGETDTEEILTNVANNFLTVTVAWAIKEASDAYDSWTTSNNWDLAKAIPNTPHLNGTHTASTSTGYYGCSLDEITDLDAASTVLSVNAYDACDYGANHQHRTPFFSGSYFSRILGGFDDFAIYLPPGYCNAFMAAVRVEPMFVVNPSFNSPAWNSRKLLASFDVAGDYVIMLHGWGGSSSFLASSSYVMDYAFRGAVHTGTGAGTKFTACTVSMAAAAAAAGDKNVCQSLAFPGGFFVLAPDGAACPLANRMWWTNSEFTGFIMDYIVFDLPSYMTFKLGLDARSVGVFGFSMGAYGAHAILMTYIEFIASIYAANAPMYPNDCFFKYNCHHICITDLIYCELLFTSFGQVLNSYVILWGSSFVISSGSTDPMGVGMANHLAANSNLASCQYYDHRVTDAAGAAVSTLGALGLAAGEPVTIADFGKQSDATGCTWQDWNPSAGCMEILMAPKNPKGSASNTVHASIPLLDTTLGNFECHGTCTPQSDGLVKAAAWSSAGASTCFAMACKGRGGLEWCAEPNQAAGADNYLDPVKALVGSLKFVPTSNIITDEMVMSAYGHFYRSMPMTKFGQSTGEQSLDTSFSVHPVLMYIHCSQNDEMGLYPFHIQYVAMFLGAMVKTCKTCTDGSAVNLSTKYVANFDDCDYHFFTENDMKQVIAWFSDALHTFVGDGTPTRAVVTVAFAVHDVAVQMSSSTGIAMCWLKQTGVFNSGGAVISSPDPSGRIFLHDFACTAAMLPTGIFGTIQSSWSSQFTNAEWHEVESMNEVEMDEDSSLEVYTHTATASKVICNVDRQITLLEEAGANMLVQANIIAAADETDGKSRPVTVPEGCSWLPGMEPTMKK